MAKKKTNKNHRINLFFLFSVIIVGILIFIKITFGPKIYIDNSFGYSFKYPAQGKVETLIDGTVRVWESKNIEPAPSNSDISGPTKYIDITVIPTLQNQSIEQVAMSGLIPEQRKWKKEFQLHNRQFIEYCFETSAFFCNVYTSNDINLYKFSLREGDSWIDSNFYKIILASVTIKK